MPLTLRFRIFSMFFYPKSTTKNSACNEKKNGNESNEQQTTIINKTWKKITKTKIGKWNSVKNACKNSNLQFHERNRNRKNEKLCGTIQNCRLLYNKSDIPFFSVLCSISQSLGLYIHIATSFRLLESIPGCISVSISCSGKTRVFFSSEHHLSLGRLHLFEYRIQNDYLFILREGRK